MKKPSPKYTAKANEIAKRQTTAKDIALIMAENDLSYRDMEKLYDVNPGTSWNIRKHPERVTSSLLIRILRRLSEDFPIPTSSADAPTVSPELTSNMSSEERDMLAEAFHVRRETGLTPIQILGAYRFLQASANTR